ncbi:amphi-Trp domain-containing protein [Streptomyces sp. Qhu-G9]|uniref:amphi-Trp domain-containing protein n=1 Tax=Streptomyces sp. Qhu-G9 TaxID=3452799 RepID=UPI0022ABD5E5|nr:amphi-Trp domain-containing protein [Streptomyces aurantiacus]WAU82965.1 amphi-Trp domain-containing protein [Streptomyces aurantiacus]
MTDLKFEQKRSLSRTEAADQLTALADALRKGGDVDLEFGHGTLSLKIPDDLRSEIEIEVDDGEIELEIEFTWPSRAARKAPARSAAAASTTGAPKRRSTPAKRGQTGAGTAKNKRVKRAATKAS